MNDLEIGFNTFENIKIIDKNGNEFWYARELMIALEYKRWDKFTNVIKAAETACEQSNNSVNNHFSQVEKMVTIGSNASRKIIDYKLKNISDEAYLKQLNGYKDYIENRFNKPTNIYLYSVTNNTLEKI